MRAHAKKSTNAHDYEEIGEGRKIRDGASPPAARCRAQVNCGIRTREGVRARLPELATVRAG
jgi:hypothetical protein